MHRNQERGLSFNLGKAMQDDCTMRPERQPPRCRQVRKVQKCKRRRSSMGCIVRLICYFGSWPPCTCIRTLSMSLSNDEGVSTVSTVDTLLTTMRILMWLSLSRLQPCWLCQRSCLCSLAATLSRLSRRVSSKHAQWEQQGRSSSHGTHRAFPPCCGHFKLYTSDRHGRNSSLKSSRRRIPASTSRRWTVCRTEVCDTSSSPARSVF
jgi:hypothetical protein